MAELLFYVGDLEWSQPSGYWAGWGAPVLGDRGLGVVVVHIVIIVSQ